MKVPAAITPVELKAQMAASLPPLIVDVRRQPAFAEDSRVIPGAIRRTPETIDDWAGTLEPWRRVVVYCVHGHEVGRDAASALVARGLDARFLEGGIAGWRESGQPALPFRAPTRWVTRERPKIDRIACPWLIRRYIDPSAEFFYVPTAEVSRFGAANTAEPYDIPGVRYSHAGPECSFDAFIRLHRLADPVLAELATIVRGADTGVPALSPQSPGLVAVSLGLSQMFDDDATMLKWGMLVYDSLFAWLSKARAERHGWEPEKLRA